MARTLNMVHLIGRLGADPDVRYTGFGRAVVTFSLATTRQWQGEDGALHEETDWHRIVASDGLAQMCVELSKGRLIYVEGRLRNSQWEQNGQTMYQSEIVASDLLLLDAKTSLSPSLATASSAQVALSGAR